VAVGLSAFGGSQPVRVFQPLPGELSRVDRAVERALTLAAADGLVQMRPDVLSVLVRHQDDAAALHTLRQALDGAGAELPLAVCVPPDISPFPGFLRDADLVSVNVDGIADERSPLRMTLERIAAARRPVMLEVDPGRDRPAATEGGAAGGPARAAAPIDPAPAARAAVDRLLAAAAVATVAGCRDIAVSVSTRDTTLAVRTYRLLAARLADAEAAYPIHLLAWPEGDAAEVLLRASVLLGSLLCDGIGDSVQIMGGGRGLEDAARARLAFNILQGTGVRLSKTEFVACPSCGRTLFDLQETTERIQRLTGHLKGVKIAVMGCIVNGPGEMADADFGYVGGAPGKVNLYVGKVCVEKGVPAAVAGDRLIELIRSQGKWVDPPVPVGAEV
jgi:1-hydroxy-2-methyl-2-(E)-butenyl 4-diphosphate synthase